MGEARKHSPWPVWIFIALATIAGIAFFMADRGCSPSASYLCWTPEDYLSPEGHQAALFNGEGIADLPRYRFHRAIQWRLHCGEDCRKPTECYYYCCGGDRRSDQSGAPPDDGGSCSCDRSDITYADPGAEYCMDWMNGNFHRLMLAAERGSIQAQVRLAGFYRHGRNGDPAQDTGKAVYWYRRAAEQGSREAQFRLGEWYEKDAGTETDCKAAIAWYSQAGRETAAGENIGTDFYAGDARRRLVDIYSDDKCGLLNPPEALRWLALAEETADWPQIETARALKLGDLYMKGGEGLPEDPKEAMKWYRKAAAAKDPDDARGAYELAMIYAKGEVVKQDFLKACQWYAIAMRDPRYPGQNICDPFEPYLKPGEIQKVYPMSGRGALPEE